MSQFNVSKKYYSKNLVCTGSKSSVGNHDIAWFFHQAQDAPLYIPLFQRRYCWGTEQFERLWTDLNRQLSNPRVHRFNRMQCHRHRNDQIVIIDGQQRLTTFSIFLACVRDVFCQQEELASDLNRLLFPHGVPVCNRLEEGKRLDSSVVPTYLDRESFYRCTLPGLPEPTNANDCISACKRFFLAKLAEHQHDSTFGTRITKALLHNCTMLYFEIADKNVWEVYEMMAVHNHTWGSKMGQGMAEVDLIKNFLLQHLATEEEQIHVYRQLWVPVETHISKGTDVTKSFDKLFHQFLEEHGTVKLAPMGFINLRKFQTYEDVANEVQNRMASGAPPNTVVCEFLTQLCDFMVQSRPTELLDEE